DAWLAQATLLDAGITPGEPVSLLVVGGGQSYVEEEVRSAGLDATVLQVDDRDPNAVATALAEARAREGSLLLVAGSRLDRFAEEPDEEASGARLITADLSHPEPFRALLNALANRPASEPDKRSRTRVDRPFLERVRVELDGPLSDHDAKRL